MVEASAKLCCPECGSDSLYRDGERHLSTGEPVKRWLCRGCGYRFSISHFKDDKTNETRQLGALLRAKKLDSATEMTVAGEQNHGKRDTQIRTIEREIKATQQVEKLLTQLKNDGRKAGTINNYRKALKRLLREGADLFDPEDAKSKLANSPIKDITKKNVVTILTCWFEFNDIRWKRPKYSDEPNLPYPPTEKEVDELIAASGKKLATYLQILRDTGARCGEISNLTWDSIDSRQRRVTIKAEKGGNSRIMPLQPKTMEMLNNLTKKNERVFVSANNMRANFHIQRIRIAKKLCNPNILKIHFHTFRYMKAINEKRKERNDSDIKEILGHKSLTSTETYLRLAKEINQNPTEDDFITIIAKTPEEIIAALNANFTPMMQMNGAAYFRKRK
jgi:integrase